MGSTPPHSLPCTPHRERPVHTKLVHHTSENHPTRLTRYTRLSVQDHPVTSHTSFLPPHKLSGMVSLVEVSLHLVLYLHYDVQLLRSQMCGGEAYPSNLGGRGVKPTQSANHPHSGSYPPLRHIHCSLALHCSMNCLCLLLRVPHSGCLCSMG